MERAGLLRDADVEAGTDDGVEGPEGGFAKVGIGLGCAIELRRGTSVNGPGLVDFVGSAEKPRILFLPGLTGLL